MTDDPSDFYEDDEPIEEIVGTFDRGEKGLTAPPTAQGSSGAQSLGTDTYKSFLVASTPYPVGSKEGTLELVQT